LRFKGEVGALQTKHDLITAQNLFVAMQQQNGSFQEHSSALPELVNAINGVQSQIQSLAKENASLRQGISEDFNSIAKSKKEAQSHREKVVEILRSIEDSSKSPEQASSDLITHNTTDQVMGELTTTQLFISMLAAHLNSM